MAGNVVLRNRFPAVTAEVIDRAQRAVAETGRQIADTAKSLMVPGHFYDSGLSQQTTQWTQLSRDLGAVQVPTEYASYPEYGTAHMSPRPALTPAIDHHWPKTLTQQWDQGSPAAIGQIEPLVPPIPKPRP